MRTEIRALHQRLHATSIYVTHDQVEAMTMADRMVVMNAGRIEQIGRPLDVYDHPETLYVAQFIGSPAINVLRGSADRGALRTEQGVTLELARSAPAGATIAAAFRPEHVEIDPQGTLAARVDVVETLGPETYVYMDASGLPICARVDRSQRMAPGDQVRLHVAPGAIHLFDTSGRRLAA
jgi:multiple sugar transport system ATP-binding protein